VKSVNRVWVVVVENWLIVEVRVEVIGALVVLVSVAVSVVLAKVIVEVRVEVVGALTIVV
jgi:hypothetical protein